MTQEIKVILGVCLTTILIIFAAIWLNNKEEEKKNSDPALLTKNARHTITTPSAKINIVEFGDFQCPACAAAHPVMQQIMQKYNDKVKFTYRHFPLPQHKNAILSAQAAEAAGQQGKFLEMYDILYDKQQEWSESDKALDLFIDYASKLNLNIDKFKEGINNTEYLSWIETDKKDGISLNLTSTPSFFLDNNKVNSFTDLPKLIEEKLSITN